jgi:hypothetical protein
MESNYSKFIVTATKFMDALERGEYESNSRVYKIVEWLRKRYNVSRYLENDVISGLMRARL